MDALSIWQVRKALLTTHESYNGGSVHFGDNNKAKVIGKGTIPTPGMSRLSNVYLVEGLKTNLLSVSQLCDSQHEVHLS